MAIKLIKHQVTQQNSDISGPPLPPWSEKVIILHVFFPPGLSSFQVLEAKGNFEGPKCCLKPKNNMVLTLNNLF